MHGPDFFAIVAAMMALVLLVDVSILWLTGRQVPELLSQLIFGVFGFYFGRAPGITRPPAAPRGQPAASKTPSPAVAPRPRPPSP
ncbi:MAG: hypothetical protein HY332_10570 [Chloroflexi bacterium]|nr:hypothetical protein [Chloroflexota bacterium]